jgi:cell cycle arrest protein BUB2
MNVLSAPFLYTMPSQLEAFACFSTFIEQSCPLYVQPTLVGVHRGLKVCPKATAELRLRCWGAKLTVRKLLDKCLKIVDGELYDHLRSKNLSAELYAFPCESSQIAPASLNFSTDESAVLTLCACTPPLEEVLRLWEFVHSPPSATPC